MLSEISEPGSGFLAELCQKWEEAAQPAVDAGIRVVQLRFGVVLGPGEGALKKMLPLFRWGLGARLGAGKQWMSWVSLADAIGAVLFVLDRADIAGPVNVTSPNPVTNGDFTRALARALGRPAFLAMPAFALRIMAGQMADEALLVSERVKPEKLMSTGFQFSLAGIDAALRAAIQNGG
jgi:uncharacterized protein (TIGR01777 family)